jgi:hypothetical protein
MMENLSKTVGDAIQNLKGYISQATYPPTNQSLLNSSSSNSTLSTSDRNTPLNLHTNLRNGQIPQIKVKSKEDEIIFEFNRMKSQLTKLTLEEEKLMKAMTIKLSTLNTALFQEKKMNEDLYHRDFLIAALIGGSVVVVVFLLICSSIKFFTNKA